jgi:hypothetical protein
MTTPDYTQKMSELRDRVGQYSKLSRKSDNKTAFASITAAIPNINTQSPLFYVAPPVVLILLLLFIKPGFVCTEHIDNEKVTTNKISYKKLFITGLTGGGIISIGLFAYFIKQKNLIIYKSVK